MGGYRWLVRVPEADLAVATLCNAYAGMDTFGRDVARLFVAPAATPPTGARVAARPAIALPVAALARHAGTYRSADGALTMDLAVVDGALAMTPRGPGPSVPALVPVADGEFEARVGDLLHAFVFTADGAGGDSTVLAIREVESGDAAAPLLRRFAPWRPDAATLATYAGTYAGENVEGVLHVRVRNGDLLLATRGFPEAALAPQDAADRFRLPQHYAARFERDAEGRVVALVLDANRVQGLRYRRE